jgi:uncharacterized peroxidase-related enzyme
MQRINALNPETATGKTKELFNGIHAKFGTVPNMMKTMGHSPSLLEGYLSLNNALGQSSVRGALGELIAIAIANANGCEYCNAAHSYIGEKIAGLKKDAIDLAREGKSDNTKIQAALTFARKLVATKGKVTNDDIASLKDAGFDDAGVADIIGHTALNILTNYFNNATGVKVDFPEVELAEASLV